MGGAKFRRLHCGGRIGLDIRCLAANIYLWYILQLEYSAEVKMCFSPHIIQRPRLDIAACDDGVRLVVVYYIVYCCILIPQEQARSLHSLSKLVSIETPKREEETNIARPYT